MKEKKYLIVEVCNPKCPFITDEIDNFCLLEGEMVLCKSENCPHGKTLDKIAEKSARTRYEINRVRLSQYCTFPIREWAKLSTKKRKEYVSREIIFIKALLGGEGK